MSASASLRPLLPAAIAMAALLLAGVAAFTHLLSRPRAFSTPWRTALAQLAAANPWRAKDLLMLALRWLAILPALWFVSFVWNLLLNAAGHAPDFQEAIRLFLANDDPWTRAGFVFFAVVLAPFAEEALFRGILLPLLVRRIGPGAGLALTAIGFAAVHADLGTFAALALFSVALSLAYARTGTLWVPVGMHALFNAANLALLLALVRAGVV